MKRIAGYLVTLVAAFAVIVGCGADAAPDPTSEPVAQGNPTATMETATPLVKSTSTPTTVAATSTPDPQGEEALAVVEAFNPEDEDAIFKLNELVYDDRNVVPVLAPLLEHGDPNRRWAALYVIALLSDTDEEIEILMPVLEDENEAFRVIAAGSLSGKGIVMSIPVLIEGLSSEEQLPFSDPPRLAADLAREALEYYSGQTFTDPTEWQNWWTTVRDSIRWNGEHYVAE